MKTEGPPRLDEVDTDPAQSQEWWDDANCNTHNASLTGLYFSDEIGDIAQAKRICSTCPVLEPCLAGAIARRERSGVWGGQLFVNGRVLASKRQRGRPPRIPRRDDQLPDVPVPVALTELVRERSRSVA